MAPPFNMITAAVQTPFNFNFPTVAGPDWPQLQLFENDDFNTRQGGAAVLITCPIVTQWRTLWGTFGISSLIIPAGQTWEFFKGDQCDRERLVCASRPS